MKTSINNQKISPLFKVVVFFCSCSIQKGQFSSMLKMLAGKQVRRNKHTGTNDDCVSKLLQETFKEVGSDTKARA